MSLKQAAQQALEALEKVITAFGPGLTLQQKAATALRQALEDETANSEHEPVAWADKVGAVIPHSHKLFQPDLLKDYTRPLYTAPPDYERGFVDGIQHHMQSSVDKAIDKFLDKKNNKERA